MKKRLLIALSLLCSFALLLCACNKSKDEKTAKSTAGYMDYENAIIQYLVKEYAPEYYSDYDCTIPSPVIVSIDNSDPEDVKAYGNFAVLNYDLEDENLELVSGGTEVGVMHLKEADDAVTVTSFDRASDGSDFDDSLKKLIGDYDDGAKDSVYDRILDALDYSKAPFANVHEAMMNAFVAQNGLDAKTYSDSEDESADITTNTTVMLSNVPYEATGEPYYQIGDGENDISVEDTDGVAYSGMTTDYSDVIALQLEDGNYYLFAATE